MPSSGLVRPVSDSGKKLDATFELSTVPIFEIVYHHKAGGRESVRAVNQDYNDGLELLLKRLAQLRLRILVIAVDSSVVQDLEPEDRELALDFPIELRPDLDVHQLRLNISRAQKPIGRRADSKPESQGNSQKRIRITMTGYDPALTYDRLLDTLLHGSQ